MNFKTSDDIPFVLRGGTSTEVAIYKSIAAINRLNYLARKEIPEFDIRTKSDEWIRCWEIEMWKRFYQKDPRHGIDEAFCQNGARVAIEMEKDPPKFKEEDFMSVIEDVKKINEPKITPKKNFFQKLIERFKK